MGSLNMKDLQCLNNEVYSSLEVFKNTITLNDLLVIDWSRNHSSIDMIGCNPGLCETNFRVNMFNGNPIALLLVEYMFVPIVGQPCSDVTDTYMLMLCESKQIDNRSGILVSVDNLRIMAADAERTKVKAKEAWGVCEKMVAKVLKDIAAAIKASKKMA